MLATVIVTVETRSADGGYMLRMLFVALWLASALLVAERGDRGAATAVTVMVLISFPIAFSGASAGAELLDQICPRLYLGRRLLYLFRRGQVEPRWTALSCAGSAASWPFARLSRARRVAG